MKNKRKYKLNAKMILKHMEKLYVIQNIFRELWKKLD